MKCENPQPIKINLKDSESPGGKKRTLQLMLQTKGTMVMPVQCRRCIPCRFNRAAQWQFRLEQEMKYAINSYLITLTYREETVPFKMWNGKRITTFKKSDHQKFMKRVRKALNALPLKKLDTRTTINGFTTGKAYTHKTWPRLKMYLVSEYGTHGTKRPHYHLILFNVPQALAEMIHDQSEKGDKGIWGLGQADARPNKDTGSIGYVTSYLNNIQVRNKTWEKQNGKKAPYSVMSKGLGEGLLKAKEYYAANNMFEITKQEKDSMTQGKKLVRIPLPTYYTQRIPFAWADKFTHQLKAQAEETKKLNHEHKQLEAQGIKNPDAYLKQVMKDKAQRMLAEKTKRKNKI